MKHLFAIAASAALTLLAGCAGFQPMHGTASSRAAFNDMVVSVADGEDESDRAAGFLIRQRLADRINPATEPTYRLEVEPSARRIGLGLRGDDSASRYDGTVRASWSVTRIDDGSSVAKGRTESTATYSADLDPYRLQATTDAAMERAARELADMILTDIALELAELPTP